MGKLIEFFKKHPIIKTLVQMVIVFFLLIGITLYGLKLYTRHGKAVLVPDVKAMALPDALRTLDRNGFEYDIIDSLYIDEAVPGTIVEQTPAAGSKVKSGRTVYLSINAYSPRMITCPKVSDMSMRQALSTLESRGLSDVRIQEVPSQYPDLAIGLQYQGETIEPGDKIPANSTVTLLVGSGISESYPDSDIEGEFPQTPDAETPITDDSWFN